MHNPFEKKGGGAMASHAYLRAFSDFCDGNIDVVVADTCKKTIELEPDKNIRYNKVYFAPERTNTQKILSVFNGYMNRYVTYVKELIKDNKYKYKSVVFDHNGIAGPLIDYFKNLNIKTITIHHNCEVEYFGDNNKGVYKYLFLHHVERWEKKSFIKSDVNLFLTRQDKLTFNKRYGKEWGISYTIGTFEFKNYEKPLCSYNKKNKNITFIITGSLGNFQTIDAISFFFDSLYEKMPDDCEIIIAGRNPNPLIVQLCERHSNVKLVPNPIDMNEIVSQADIYICATRIGGGLKLRVMDGLKLGLPVITHECSARGFDAFYDNCFFKKFSTPEEFSDGLNALIELCKAGTYSKEKIQSIYEVNFSYQSGLNRLRYIMNKSDIEI